MGKMGHRSEKSIPWAQGVLSSRCPLKTGFTVVICKITKISHAHNHFVSNIQGSRLTFLPIGPDLSNINFMVPGISFCQSLYLHNVNLSEWRNLLVPTIFSLVLDKYGTSKNHHYFVKFHQWTWMAYNIIVYIDIYQYHDIIDNIQLVSSQYSGQN